MEFLDYLKEIFDYLSSQDYPIGIIVLVVSVLAVVILIFAIKQGSLSSSVKTIKTILGGSETMSKDGTVFTNECDQYYYDKTQGCLVKMPTKRDIAAEIDSHLDSVLASKLEALLHPTAVEESDEVVYTSLESKLDYFSQVTEEAEEIREKFNLSPDLSITEIFDWAESKSSELREKIANANKEVKVDETSQDK